ncbi:hypothetical protein OA257_00980 [Bacteroidota bacterium]|nr:hypothetical protein [Bacteroidota bacterium]
MDLIENKLYSDKNFIKFLLIVLSFALINDCKSQERKTINIINSDSTISDKNKHPEYLRLLGNIVFEHENYFLRCDSAHHYLDIGKIKCFGNISIESDSVLIYCKDLVFDSKENTANLKNNVKLKKSDKSLFTNNLIINFSNDNAIYYGGGQLEKGSQNIISKNGEYNIKTDKYLFQDSVKTVIENNRLITNHLNFDNKKNLYLIDGPSNYIKQDLNLYFEYGRYNSDSKKGVFSKNNYIRDTDFVLQSDMFITDEENNIEAIDNVRLVNEDDKIFINSGYALFKDSLRYFTEKPKISFLNKDDTLNINSEIVLSKKNTLISHKDVKIISNNLLGKCDSLSFNQNDSLISLYGNPVIWVDGYQVTSDTIILTYFDNEIKNFYLPNNPFICFKSDTTIFNQIKGNEISGTFSLNILQKVNVHSQGESIYLVKEFDKNIGLNHTKSPQILINFFEGKVKEIIYSGNAESLTVPIKEITEDKKYLKNFYWRWDEKLEILN